jgi:prepilin-type N-terminal cleavage/methylation domain-containing protein
MNKKGFTLIELLVVIAIIGLLSTLAVVALGSARQKARDSKRLSDLKQVQTALELYFTDNNTYPLDTDITLGSADVKCLGNEGFAAVCSSASGTVYMGMVPSEPTPGAAGYTYNGATTSYTITATLEGDINDLTKGSVTASQNGITNTPTP